MSSPDASGRESPPELVELTQQLTTQCSIQPSPSAARRKLQYKSSSTLLSSEETTKVRRERYLQAQKNRRSNFHRVVRCLVPETAESAAEDGDDDNDAKVSPASTPLNLTPSKQEKRKLWDANEEGLTSEETREPHENFGLSRPDRGIHPILTEHRDNLTKEISENESKRSRRTANNPKERQRHQKIVRQRLRYQDQLMIPETLTDIPPDLVTDWLLMPLPFGQPCLVVANHGKTKAYLANGNCIDEFQSPLPAGSILRRGSKDTSLCILDCLFDTLTSRFYVRDMMYWRGQPFYDCEADFRYFWLQTRFQELEPARPFQRSYTFHPLPFYSCDQSTIKRYLTQPFTSLSIADVHQFAIIHRQSHYHVGYTPLYYSIPVTQAPRVCSEIEQVFGSPSRQGTPVND
ncbi:hypothetical protein IWQ62_003603 [Dispira parvispora]|uniref:Snurportin-1 n=1 Tax=Dispira parvispora TaxID=1520584 RepID=A0A9W8E1H4_9FUNG|nr:hypothetical protein IWQ62_003603 [Dispira parvispora]